jgi:hypothetical protein
MYYIYFYRDPITLEIFYIGKGKGNRMYSHWSRRETHYNLLLREKLQTLHALKMKPIIEKHLDNLENYEAFYLEFNLISEYGRIGLDQNGILCNRSSGLEHFNIPLNSLVEIKEYLKDKKHFNHKEISTGEKDEVCNAYLNGSSILNLSKQYSHGPDTIKKILHSSNIEIRNRGGQFGKDNGMYGVKRENNAYFKGKSHSESSKNKISNSLKGKTSKKLEVNSIKFNSVQEASEYTQIPRQTLTRYAKLNKKLIRNEKIYIIQYL